MMVTRRNCLHLLAGVAVSSPFSAFPFNTLPSSAWAVPLPRDADIVVIGAGAAGIAAARWIAAAHRKVIVVEATDKAGGRCLTDLSTFSLPFDRGARRLYNPETNPVIKLVRSLGRETVVAPQGQKIRIGRRNARASEAEEFLATRVRANRDIDDAARKRDIDCASILPKDLGDWAGAIEFLLGAYSTGKDLKDLSAADQLRLLHRDSAVTLRQGLGSLMVGLAENLPVSLATPATRVIWNNHNATVETPAGNIVARAVIITTSTNMLVSGKIKFVPDLPRRQLDAAVKLSLGSYDHIALELPGNPLGLARDDVLIEQSKDNRTGILFANIGGASLCSIDVGGNFGHDLSAQGEAAMIAFAIEWLTKLFGNNIAAAVKRASATRWDAAPYVLGAMSAAAPGAQFGRHVLMEPLGALFLAGEAAHETQWGTVGGAWESGERAAEAALKKIGAFKDANPRQAVKMSKGGR